MAVPMTSVATEKALFTWDEKYRLGVSKMDDQHKDIIHLMNALYSKARVNAPRPEQLACFDRLLQVSEDHFREEEVHMTATKYSEVEIHKRIHKTLIDRLRKIREDARTAGFTAKDFDFLKVWLSGHILGIDMKYAKR